MTAREHVREMVRAEIAKHNPLPDARRPLELIAETSLRFIEDGGPAQYQVVDYDGRPRTRIKDGEAAELTIEDLVAELRRKHPTLFEPARTETGQGIAGNAEPTGPIRPGERTTADENGRLAPEPEAGARPAAPIRPPPPRPETASRDWMILGSRDAAAPRVVEPAGKSYAFDQVRQYSTQALNSMGSRLGSSRGAIDSKIRSVRETVAAARSHPAVARLASSASRLRAGSAYVGGGLALLALGFLVGHFAGRPSGGGPSASRSATVASSRVPSQPAATSAPPSPAGAPGTTPARSGPASAGPISGVPEILDTGTLRVEGKVIRLFGVEWARGAQAEDLGRYLQGRAIACQPATSTDVYRCQVDGRDLSEVVLFNGGGRATSDATPNLVAAESHAKSERIGVWRK